MKLVINSKESLDRAISELKKMVFHKKFVRMTITGGLHRSISQNNLYYRWIEQLVREGGEYTADGYRCFCKLNFFFPLLVEDNEDYARAYENMIRQAPESEQMNLMHLVDVTKECTVEQMSRGMTDMQHHFETLAVDPVFLTGLEDS